MDKLSKIRCDLNYHAVDEGKGIMYLFLWSRRLMTVDLNTGAKTGAYKTIPYCNQMILNEQKDLLIFKNTVGQFAVFNVKNLNEPIWKFKLKKICNTDYDFVLVGDNLYGTADFFNDEEECYWYRYYIINLKTREILVETAPKEGVHGEIKNKVKSVLASRHTDGLPAAPDNFEKIFRANWFYGNDKFDFVSAMDEGIIVFPKGCKIPYKYSREFYDKKETEQRKIEKEKRIAHEKRVKDYKVFDGTVYCLNVDEAEGVMYCAGDKLYIIDLNTGKIVGEHSVLSGKVKYVYLNKENGLVNVCGDKIFAAYKKGEYEIPVWQFEAGVSPTFICFDKDCVYWLESRAKREMKNGYMRPADYERLYYKADITERKITYETRDGLYHREYDAPSDYMKAYLKMQGDKTVIRYPCEYESDRFLFTSTTSPDCFLVIPKTNTQKKSPPKPRIPDINKLRADYEWALAEADNADEILSVGYEWALANIEKEAEKAGEKFYRYLGEFNLTDEENILYSIGWLHAEMDNGGMSQYFTNGDKLEFALLLRAFNVIGAEKTVKVILKGIKLIDDFNKKENPTDSAREKLDEKLDDLENKLGEDYVQLAIDYIKK